MKTYEFKFTAIPAEFRNGAVSMKISLFNGTDTTTEHRTCTLPEAIAYLPEYSDKVNGPHSAQFSLRNRHERKPSGFSKATTQIYNRKEQALAA